MFARCKSTKPLEGVGDMTILFNSVMMRSALMIFSRSAFFDRASKVSSSIWKFSCVANLTQRMMRRGSSLNVMLGSSGVFIMPFSKSSRPPNGSTNSPKRFPLRQIAMAFIVKSLRFWSSSNVPFSTIGLRESWV